MTITYRSGVSIGEIAVYAPALAIAAFLAVRHGFNRSAGWMFLVIFALARIIGSAMQIATISSPDNVSLYTGYAILQNIGLSPLMLATIGLLSRLLENINRTHHTAVSTRVFQAIELVITVGLILGIVGGVNAADNFTSTGKYTPNSLSKAGSALFIVSYVAIVIATIFVSFSVKYAAHGEKRILTAVALSLPFLLVRLVYSIMSTFAHNKNFNLLSGSTTILLCVAFIEELIIVVIFEAIGLTLPQVSEPEFDDAPAVQADGSQYAEAAPLQPKPSGAGHAVLNIAKKTIIGHIVMAFIPKDRDVEMHKTQRQPAQRR
jgi:hypothetical protein